MQAFRLFASLIIGAALFATEPTPALAQHETGTTDHAMWGTDLGGGWRLLGMGQLFPVLTVGAPGEDASALNETELYLTQPAAMLNVESPGQRLALRTTLNAEGLTLEDGELTFGGWGEGFIDKRHPHTLLHELMLSLNLWDAAGGSLSLSGGKGFAPYGTDDPMARPGLKYPTNHHLSQILERWTVNAVYLRDGWSLEAGVFGGAEPEGPYDLSNIDSFGDSWSARLAKRWGGGMGPMAAWEASASYGSVAEAHGAETERTRLWNAALRHARAFAEGTGGAYALVEASMSDPAHHDGYFSVLGETRLELGRHQPYARIEFATRPEYPREGVPGTSGFFRYDHDADPIGATRWLITTLAYAVELTRGAFSLRPFAEAQLHAVSADRGGIDPEALFGTDTFWSASIGARVFLGGGPMRMGSYGVLDPMTAMERMMSASEGMEMPQNGEGHERH